MELRISHCWSGITGLGWLAVLEPATLSAQLSIQKKERNPVKEKFQAIIRNSLTRFFKISEGLLSFIHKNGKVCPGAPFPFPCITLELLIAPNTLTRALGYFLL